MKKSLFLIGLSLLSILPIANTFAATEVEPFSDLSSSDPSRDAIEWMQEEGIVQGYADGTFQSLNSINRAEFTKILIESITDDITGSNCFSDVADEWFAPYVCTAKTLGIVNGYEDGTFQPANEINFAEASKVITNALDLEAATIDSTDPWYKAFVEPLSDLNAIPMSVSDLDKSIARGEMAEVVWRVEEQKSDLDSLKYEELEGRPVQVESCEALKDIFLSDPDVYSWYEYEYDDVEESSSDSSTGTSDSESVQSSSGESEASDDYSSTNTQVAGVDESDVVKNNGEYIYVLNSDVVEIVKAYPADAMTHVATLEFEESFRPTELYLDGDTLVVIGNNNNPSIYTYEYDSNYEAMIDPYYHSDRTAVLTYDVSDPSNPTLLRDLEFDGNYSDSRKVDETLYLVLNKWDLYYYANDYDPATLDVEEVLPRYYDSSTDTETPMVDCTDIRYLPRERELNYVMAVAIQLDDTQSSPDSEVLIGSSENLYASPDNLYIASTNYDGSNYYYDWTNAKTLVHRFGLYDGKIDYEASGKVPGTILNQFSMDEHEDHFRIATTEGSIWDSENPSSNNVYILDDDMNTTGSIENIAPGEHIYSTRFMGDRGYMVTFKKVDPFFVFDLSDPANPTILGELKIPGYSDYLHPYDETHILGFGKDAEDASEEETWARDLDFAWYQGMKVALFDVTDPSNPTQLFSVGIGDRGTFSELLYDHKALLFSASKGLLAFPVTVAKVMEENADANTYGETVFEGAYIYNLDLTNGFDLQTTPTHYATDSFEGDSDYWNSYDFDLKILRILTIGDQLYTVSEGMVKAFDMDTWEEVNRVEM